MLARRLHGMAVRARPAWRYLSENAKPAREHAEPEIWTDRLARLDARTVRRWAVGTAVPVLALPVSIAVLPGLDETRRAFSFGLSYPTDVAQLPGMQAWQVGIGGVGLVGGFGAASGYIAKHAERLGPVFSAFRAPWACFGAVLGAQLCYELAPHMMGHSLKLAKTAAFVLDGLEADLLGKSGAREWEKEAQEYLEERGFRDRQLRAWGNTNAEFRRYHWGLVGNLTVRCAGGALSADASGLLPLLPAALDARAAHC